MRKLIDENGIRLDGRKWDELRPDKDAGRAHSTMPTVQPTSSSAEVDHGSRLRTKGGSPEARSVLPIAPSCETRYHMAPFSVDE